MTTDSVVRDFSGFLPVISVAGVSIPTYFIVISAAFCISLLWLVRRAKAQQLSRNTALDIALVLMISGFLGARALHIFYEAPSYYAEKPMRVFEVWMGGFVWYGGVIAGAIATFAFMRYRKLAYGRWLDLYAPIIALGYAIGRIACLLTGCCFGSVCHLHSGFSFRHPTQAYAIIWEVATLALLLRLEKKRGRVFAAPGSLFFVWMVAHGVGRIVMEFFRDDDRGAAIAGLSISTWISLLLVMTGLALLARSRKRA